MNLFKRCPCLEPSKCDHPFWFRFRLHGEELGLIRFGGRFDYAA